MKHGMTTQTPGCTIVHAALPDLQDLVPLFDAYRVFYRQPSDPMKAREFMGERITRGESIIFLARDETSRDALGFAQLYPAFSSVTARRLWILNDLYVAEAARRRGVARGLMETARTHAVNTAAVRLVLQTAHANNAAQALY